MGAVSLESKLMNVSQINRQLNVNQQDYVYNYKCIQLFSCLYLPISSVLIVIEYRHACLAVISAAQYRYCNCIQYLLNLVSSSIFIYGIRSLQTETVDCRLLYTQLSILACILYRCKFLVCLELGHFRTALVVWLP